MKKKGILTFHNANNLGAVLQAYALQRKLTDFYGENYVEIIDYDNGNFKEKANSKSIKGLLKNVYYLIKNRGFKRFRNKYLKLSNKYTKDNIKNSNNEYGTIICGSDQIWNLSCSHNDYNYFLSFANSNVKKVSYAASLGNYHYKTSEKKKVYSLLKDFYKISIREKNSLSDFKDSKLDIKVMPDPVFLLEKEEWLKITPKKLLNKKYILVYLIQEDVNVMNAAIKYAKQNNCKIVSNKKSFQFMLNNSPEKFLSWIYYADAVFTNSFHGTAFSIIFNKSLGADIELKNGEINHRINDILQETKNMKCIINSNSYNPYKATHNSLVNKIQDTGISYLLNI